MPSPKPLTPSQATHTLANRFTRLADRLRQLNTRFGVRPYRVFLTWTRWTGAERGEGDEVLYKRLEVLPTPRVDSLDRVTFNPYHAGVLPTGSVQLSEVSARAFTDDILRGKAVPGSLDGIPEPYSFFYEIVEDGRDGNQDLRTKFRLLSVPFRRAGKLDFIVLLERISEDRTREDTSRQGP